MKKEVEKRVGGKVSYRKKKLSLIDSILAKSEYELVSIEPKN